MADYNKRAFDAMNAADPDANITGGAIMHSEFEMDMTPKEQQSYRKSMLGALDSAYRSDPHKGKLGFSDWLDNLRPDLVMERARKWEEVRRDKDVMNKMDPKEFRTLEDAGLIEMLLQKHTGKLEDVRDIVGADVPRPIEEFQVTPTPFRR